VENFEENLRELHVRLFHKDVPTVYIREVCDVMMAADHHEYQVLTKRPERLKELLSTPEFADAAGATHILWGVSIDDRKVRHPTNRSVARYPSSPLFLVD
jgi:protein gp37